MTAWIAEEDRVLQVDADICLNVTATPEDLVSRAAALFRRDECAVTVLALPCYRNHSLPGYGAAVGVDGFVDADGAPFRFEIRCSFLHMPRFRSMLSNIGNPCVSGLGKGGTSTPPPVTLAATGGAGSAGSRKSRRNSRPTPG